MKMQTVNDVESTSDCLEILNGYKPSKWKRKTKFKIKLGEYYSSEVRVFSDGTETLSILQTDEDGAYLINYDLNEIRPLIEKIQNLAKKYFTHDYGQVYLNPWEMKIWLIGGDGGIFYSEKSAALLSREIEENGFDCDIECPGFEVRIPEIKATYIEGEHFPPLHEDETEDDEIAEKMSELGLGTVCGADQCRMEWIQVAMAVDLCNI